MESVTIELQERVNLLDAIATGNLVAFNTCDREIIVAIARKLLDYRHTNSGASYEAMYI